MSTVSETQSVRLKATPPSHTMREFYLSATAMTVAVAACMLFTSSFGLTICNLALLAVIGATGLNLLMGTAGQVSIGNAAFVASGAFTVAFLDSFGAPAPLGVLAAIAVATLFGSAVGIPALRIKGIYLILATMAAHFLVLFIGEKYQFAFAGSAGFTIEPVVSGMSRLQLQRFWAVVILIFAVATVLVATLLQSGRSGRIWRTIREREDAAPAMGINVTRYKIIIFAISSGIIGLQGALYAYYRGNVSVEDFPLSTAIAAIAMILIGGLGSISGAVVGAFVITILPFVTPGLVGLAFGKTAAVQYSAQVSLILYGVFIIGFISYARAGIRGWIVAFVRSTGRTTTTPG